MKRVLFLTTVMSAVALLAGGVAAQAVEFTYVDQAYWSGIRSAVNSGQITATDGWTGKFAISWLIEPVPAGLKYTYTFTDAYDSNGNWLAMVKDVSHLLVGVSPDFEPADVSGFNNVVLANVEIKTNPKDTTGDKPNPYLPSDIFAMKLEPADQSGNIAMSFVTRRMPVWGSFYAVDGTQDKVWAAAWNVGLGTSSFASVGTTVFDPWVAVPDTRLWVPEPVFFQFGAMMGLGGLGVFRLRRR